ncbi:MAG: Leg1-related protein [Myxococcota bacterium]
MLAALLVAGVACDDMDGRNGPDVVDLEVWEADPLGADPSDEKADLSAAERAFSEGTIITEGTPIYAFQYTNDPSQPVALTEITTGYNSRLPYGTPVGVFGIDREMGLVQISEWGHFVRISDVEPNESHPRYQPWDAIANAPSQWTGVVSRDTPVHHHVGLNGATLDTPRADTLRAGETVGVFSYVAHDEHGTWAMVRSAGNFQIVDARDLVIDGTTTFDANRYEDRMRILALLEATYPYPIPDTGHAWTDDPNYGIELQTEWQWASGRAFEDASGRATGWWANANYTLSVWQLVALQERGEFPDVYLVTPESGSHGGWSSEARFEITPEVTASWQEYYDQRRDYQLYGFGGATPEQAAKHLQRLMWDPHVEAITLGLHRNEDLLATLPAGERQFAESWGYTVVEYLAAANFPTGETTLDFIQGIMLPNRLVRPTDFAGASELPPTVILGIQSMLALHEYEQPRGYPLLRVWRQAANIAESRGLDEVAYRGLRNAIEGIESGQTQAEAFVDGLIDQVQCVFQLNPPPNGELCDVQRED